MDKRRLEAFSDGVFAIVITLLVLELKLPAVKYDALGQSLVNLLPSIAATLLDGVDGVLLWLNIVFLLSISFMPFTPAVYRAQVRIYLHGLAMLFYLRRTPHLASAIIMGISSCVPDALASE